MHHYIKHFIVGGKNIYKPCYSLQDEVYFGNKKIKEVLLTIANNCIFKKMINYKSKTQSRFFLYFNWLKNFK